MRLAGYLIAYAALRLGFLAVAHVFSPQQALIWLVATYTGPVLLLLVFGVLPKASKLLSSALVRPRQSLAFLRKHSITISGLLYQVSRILQCPM